MKWDKYYWKKVKLTDVDNQVFIGTVDDIDDKDDTESGQYEIDLSGTKQFPGSIVSFREDEIKSIEVIN